MNQPAAIDVAPYLGTIEWSDGETAEFAFVAPHGASPAEIAASARDAAYDQFDGGHVIHFEPLEP
jgi:hypothetical protein